MLLLKCFLSWRSYARYEQSELSYLDGQGTNETLLSAATAPVTNVNDAPVGNVITDASQIQVAKAAPAKARSAKEIVNGVCAGCHVSGVLGAPKLGDKAAWKVHLAEGIEHVYDAAINGEGGMPARGGDATLSDADVKAAVDYMIKDAGL